MTTSPESKWTKGPWRVAPAKDYPNSLHIEVDTADRGQTGHICQVGMRDDPAAQADARLIASAPDMASFVKKHADAGDVEAQALWRTINGAS